MKPIPLTTLLACVYLLACSFATNANTVPESKFAAFIGEWTLKEDRFQQVWDGRTVETLSIANHYTKCDSLNSTHSTICVVNAGDLKGQIYWAFDTKKKTLHHLSHFGTHRIGVGMGFIDGDGNLKNRVTFTDEPEGTYRIYEYVWVSADEYTMMSRQYNADNIATGNWYGGTFVRIKTNGVDLKK